MNTLQEMNNFYYHMSLFELQIMNGTDHLKGLSYNSILYLNVIEQMQECTVSKIAEVLRITKSAVTLKIIELEKQGAIIKTQSAKDKRVFYLTLSPSMQHTFSIYDQVFVKIEKDLTVKYTKEQLESFGDILHTISGYNWRTMQNE